MSEKQIRVLIVDDNPDDRALYQRLLRRTNDYQFEIFAADSGGEGLDLCESERPDCVLLDYRMPDLDGLQFLTELAKRQKGAAVPLIMVTGQGDESVAVQAMKNGAQDYLIKSTMASQDLQRAILNAIEKGSLHRKIKEQQAELERNNRLLLEKHAELEQYAYVASHDLQEPLRMVASYLQLLERRYKSKLDADADKYIGYAVDGATRMQKLIGDLLAFSRVSTRGKDPEPVDCEVALRHSLANLRLVVQESGAEITHDPLPTVLADPTQLSQLLQNLLANAIKFRGTDPPRVHIGATAQADEWEIAVRDNGIGFDPQFSDRIFVIFQRLHGKTEYPGTGIGLSICKKIVQRHGGRIWVDSAPGQGSTFYFTLPAGQPEPSMASQAETRAARG
jgi:light-regulated signal transduction histidine kinase (bacteriophytochrome)